MPLEADALARKVSAMLPRIKITDLLVEVDVWTAFTQHFVQQEHRPGGKGDGTAQPPAPSE